ncbi:Scr1 family TA system antitoxin-like transcriptional regulator [Streptomyces sp. YIM 98790]|uniref:Scr1 family TA system antitoxin-like transcriptional regulator n=1 Tax=Streptomyces sp. YIM 98790 TaxID=2689077 RepID=UPI00140C5534|nr:Scr1 family TA system antitoxin-like transcriptional regulator [Streptomyces sp. YIM 98790]
MIPGLLQTEDYARALTRVGLPRDTDAEVEKKVAFRMRRQRVLTAPTARRCIARSSTRLRSRGP